MVMMLARGEMYGDCSAETNADDGGEINGELYGDDDDDELANEVFDAIS